MTIYVTVTDDEGNELGFDDIPVHCQADECDAFVAKDEKQFTLTLSNWSFKIFLWLCPRHLGMAAASSEMLDENP